MFKHSRITRVLKQSVGCLAFVMVAVLSAPASAGAVFRVTEGNVASTPGTPANTFLADFLHGSYDETLTTTGINTVNPLTATGGTFASSAYFAGGSYTLLGLTQSSFMNSPETAGYKTYALFVSPGTFSCTTGGAVAPCVTADRIDFVGDTTPGASTIKFFADPDSNNGFVAPPNGTVAYGITDSPPDDILLGTATLLTLGQGHEFPPPSTANGDFQLIWGNWSLTPAGATYFTLPPSFYTTLSVAGVFNTFNPSLGANTRTNGSANAEFSGVPEPASIFLMGAALSGLGWVRRRRQG